MLRRVNLLALAIVLSIGVVAFAQDKRIAVLDFKTIGVEPEVGKASQSSFPPRQW